MGTVIPKTKIKFRDGYQVNYAHKIKKATGMRVVALGMINSENLIKNIFKNKKADLVAVSRRFINDPFWLIKHKLKINKDKRLLPKPYTRCF